MRDSLTSCERSLLTYDNHIALTAPFGPNISVPVSASVIKKGLENRVTSSWWFLHFLGQRSIGNNGIRFGGALSFHSGSQI